MQKCMASFGIVLTVLVFTTAGFGQLSFTANGTQTIDFSTTIGGVNNGTFDGSGFTPTPAVGQLDSDAFAVTGFSDGSLAFGGTMTAGDFARGTTAGGETTGGIFGYTTNPAIYIQPGGSDFTPGDITLRIQNNGATNIQQLTISYNILVLNNASRANSFNFSFSSDDVTYTPIPAADFTSAEAADPLPVVTTFSRSPIVISGLSIAPGAFYYLRWTGDDVSGAGSRDEFGLDNIQVTAQFAVNNSTFNVLNEIQVSNPGLENGACHYIELRGDANSSVPSNYYVLEVEGDSESTQGQVDFVRNISGASYGSNGILVITGTTFTPVLTDHFDSKQSFKTKQQNTELVGTGCGSRNYSASGATVLLDSNFTAESGSSSFLLVHTNGSVISSGTDLDLNNDGVIDNLPAGSTIIDAVGWMDNMSGGPVSFGTGDFVYGGVDVTPGNTSGAPDAATRNFMNVTPLDVNAWFADDIADTGSEDSVQYDQTNLLGTYFIDFITPGRQNLAPTSAAGLISGRVLNSGGNGIGFVTLRLSGGTLQEPIYRVTNQFGRYSFGEIEIGQSYVLEALSGRYMIQNPTRVINLGSSITDADFTVDK